MVLYSVVCMYLMSIVFMLMLYDGHGCMEKNTLWFGMKSYGFSIHYVIFCKNSFALSNQFGLFIVTISTYTMNVYKLAEERLLQ